MSSPLVLLYLLGILVETNAQLTYPYVSFMGEFLLNHSYVDLNLVGEETSDPGNTVRCHTDLSSCCTEGQGADRGDWYYPDGNRLPFISDGISIYETRLPQRVDLSHREGSGEQYGIYFCEIATNEFESVQQSVYVGLYATGGDITVLGITFTADSDLNGATPQFTLTCTSTGGPATTVTWTRDSVTVTEGTETVLDDPVTAQYTHTLTVTGRLGGLYTCTVANNKPSNDSADFNVQAASAPTNLTAVQDGPTSILVSWSPPDPLGDTTGYRIDYTNDSSSDSVTIDGGSTASYTLTGLQNGASYTISIIATSQTLPSDTVTADMAVGLLPDQLTVIVEFTGATTISLSWSISNGSVVTSYEVVWQRDTTVGCPYADEGSVTVSAASFDYLINGLEQDSRFTVTVTASNAAGSSQVTVTAMTDDAAPSAAPDSVSISEVTSSSFTVQWEMVPCIYRNGNITGYLVQYTGGGSTQSLSVSGANTNEVTIAGLTASTTYSVRVAAVNDAGTGPLSSSQFTVTLVEAPVLSTNTTTAISISLSWTSGGSEGVSYEVMWQRDTTLECPDDEDEDSATISSTSYHIRGLEEDSRYSITVTASNAEGSSEVSNTVTAMTEEAAPSAPPDSVSISEVTSSSITVQWEMVPCIHRNGDIIGYSVQHTGSGSTQTMSVSGSHVTVATITGLTASTAYLVRVAAANGAGTGVFSSSQFTVTLVVAPVLSSSSTTATSISLSWTSGGEGVDYKVMWQRDTSLECPDVDNGSTNITNGSTSHTIVGLQENSSYSITVTASSGEDNSEISNSVTAMTLEAAPSATPTSVSTSTNSSSSITVQWGQVDCIDRNGDITGYFVRYTGGGNTQFLYILGDSSGGMYVITNLEPSTNYSIGVAAMNGELIGPYSTAVNQLTEVSALVLKVDSVSATSISLSWNSTGSEGLNYEVQWLRDTSVGCLNVDRSNILTGGSTSYDITGLEEDSSYIIKGIAFNEDSSTLHQITVMTQEAAPSAAPSNVTVSEVNDTSVTVQWEMVPCIHQNGDITGYRVQYEEVDGISTTVSVSGGDVTEATITGLASSTNYSVQVAAVNNVGTGVFSSSLYVDTPVTALVLSVESTTATTISFSWTAFDSEDVIYLLMWQRDTSLECPDGDVGNDHTYFDFTNYTITRLEEDSIYNITVIAINNIVVNNSITAMTLEAAPSVAPTSLRVSGVNASSITVQWDTVPCIEQNGNITGYLFRYSYENSQNYIISISGENMTEAAIPRQPTEYSVSVAAVNGAGTGPFSSSHIIASLDNDSILSAGTLTATSISISWISGGEGIDSVVMWQRDNSVECPDVDDEGSVNITSYSNYTVTGLEEDSSYNITVVTSVASISEISNTITAMTQEAAPSAAPSRVTVSEENNTSITVQWEMVPCIHQNGDITGYRVQYEEADGISTTVSVSGGDVTEATITGLASTTNYSVQVAAVNDAGTGVFSRIVLVLTQDEFLILSVGSITATSISLSWTSGGEGVDYELTWQRDTSLGCPDVENEGSTTFSAIITDGSSYDTDDTDESSYDISGLEENSTYIITLTEFDAQGSNTYFITATTLEAAPSAAPSLVTLSEITNSSITLQWDMVPCIERNGDITGYRVQYNDTIVDIFGDDLGATIIGLTPSTIYSVQVAAVNSAGIGVYSDPIYLLTSAIDCGALEPPENGSVFYNDTVAIYSCHDGYYLVGDNESTCLITGVWNNTDVECRFLAQRCFSDSGCTGSVVEAPGPTPFDCCVGTDDGQSFGSPGVCTTPQCIVHGFEERFYSTSENEALQGINFRPNVKGIGQPDNIGIIVGMIILEEDTAILSDVSNFRAVVVPSETNEQQQLVANSALNIQVIPQSDTISLELDDRINLRFTPNNPAITPEAYFAGTGEFIRYVTSVRIIDDDSLTINFFSTDYDVGEEELIVTIEMTIREAQIPFTLTLTPTTADDVLADTRLIATDYLSEAFTTLTEAGKATPGLVVGDYDDLVFVKTIPPSTSSRVISQDIRIEDDNINEIEQQFALVGELGPEVPEEFACFRVTFGEAECRGRVGTTRIRIRDNDPMIIGFGERRQTISEAETLEGEEGINREIVITSLRTSEIVYRVGTRSVIEGEPRIEPSDDVRDIQFDGTFGSREETTINNLVRSEDLRINTTILVPLSVFIRDDNLPEEEECFELSIFPINTPTMTENFVCNMDGDGFDEFLCEHEICIVDDDEPFRIGFDQTTYTVLESAGFVEVCVNLTFPPTDILGERVTVLVFHNDSSIYVPPNPAFATPDPPMGIFNRHNMIPRSDYEEETRFASTIRSTFIEEERRQICYHQVVYDDERLELNETAGLDLDPDDLDTQVEVEPFYDDSVVFIIDDDTAVVGLEETFYQISETDGVVVVCVVVYEPDISCPIEFPFDVMLSTIDGSAVSTMDYGALSTIVTFGECDTQQCVDITIVDDGVLENVESFFVNLESTPGLDSRITLDPVRAAGVQIIDNEGTCEAAGFDTCCVPEFSESCAGQPQDCYCDTECFLFGDCCRDIDQFCTFAPPEGDYLLFASHRTINHVDLNGENFNVFIGQLSGGALSINYYYSQGYMYWTDYLEDAIYRANLTTGMDREAVVNTHLPEPEDIAVDWVSNKLYWIDSLWARIEVMDISSGQRAELIRTNNHSIPRGIALDPLVRYIFWTDWGEPALIESASMDGRARITLHSVGINEPFGITCDYETQRVYWCDSGLDRIEYSFYDGSERNVLVSASDGVEIPFALTIYNDLLYWTDWQENAIYGTHKIHGTDPIGNFSDVIVIYEGLPINPNGIEAISASRQPAGDDLCELHNCDHFCVLSSVSGRSCMCQTGYILNDDLTTCNEDPNPTVEPTSNGSCMASGYTSCCEVGFCGGYPANCFCDANCHSRGDCCNDIEDICPQEVGSCIAAGYDTCCTDDICAGVPEEAECYCDPICLEYGDCCEDFEDICPIAALVLSVSTTTATTIALSWISGGSEVTIYQLMWQRNTSLECPDEDVGYDFTYADFTDYTITGLEEDSSYNITVIAIYNDSIAFSNTVTAMTLEAVPSAAPTSLRVSGVNASSITVQWDTVPCIEQNGDITGYSVQYIDESLFSQNYSVSGESMTEATIPRLPTIYSIEVAAVNDAGTGVFSSSHMIVSLVDGEILSVGVTTATTISLSWTGIEGVSYEMLWQRDTSVECPDVDDEGSVNITGGFSTYTIAGLEEDSSYNITLIVSDGEVTEVSNTITAMTLEAAPSAAPTSVITFANSPFSIIVFWGEVDCIARNGNITGYSVRYTGGGSTQLVNISGDSSGGMYDITNLDPSTNYSIGVAAMNGELIGPYSSAVNQLTEVSAIVLTVDSVTATSISLSWNDTGSEALNYDVYWDRNTSVGCPEVSDFNYTLNVGFTNYTITGVEENSSYSVYGVAINEVSLTYDMVTVMTLEAAPSAAPSNVTVSETTNSSITVRWEMVPCIHQNGDITGYRIQYEAVGGTQATVSVSGGDVTEVAITGLAQSTYYYVQVAAVNDVGTGVFSRIVLVLTQDEFLILSLGSITATSLSLSWTSGGEGVNYELTWQRHTLLGCPDVENEGSTTFNTEGSTTFSTEGSTTFSIIITDGSTSYDIYHLEENSAYIITLTEFDARGSNTYFITAMTLEAAPSAAPSLVIPSEITNSSITLQWDMVPCLEQNGDITGYRVQYNDSIVDIFGDDLGATIIGLTPSTIYSVQVAAVNSAGIGVYSDPIYLVTSAIDCEALEPPENGSVFYNATVAIYFCHDGYYLVGGNESTCLNSGVWSNTDVECRLIDCGDLDPPPNGVVSYFSTTVNSIATYSCNTGYALNGEIAASVCMSSGVWSNVTVECILIDCGQLLDPMDGTVSVSTTTLGSVANYSCETGYGLIGNRTRTCLNTSSWSNSQPLCALMPTIAVSGDVAANRNDSVDLDCNVFVDSDTSTNVYWLSPLGHVLDAEITTIPLFVFLQITSVITLHDIKAEDGGYYTCVAENEAGSTNASLTVYVAPYFTIKPVDIFTTSGSVENFICEAEAFPPPTIHWVSLTQDLLVSGMGSGDESVLVLYGESLVFDPVLFEDAGTIFQCIASNGYGENITSDDVTITVSPEGGVFVTSDAMVYEDGDDGALTCSHQGGPGNAIQWWRGDNELQDETGNILNVFGISALDIGVVYTCVVSNLAGEGYGKLRLPIAPVIALQPQQRLSNVTETVAFCCNATGYPTPAYAWNKVNGSLPLSSSVNYIDSSCLVIHEVDYGDAGEYFCTATSNNITVASTTALLTVSPSGSVGIYPYNDVFDYGDSVNLICSAEGGPGNTYQWAFNGTVLQDMVSDHLVLPFITASGNGGMYMCLVSNAAGSDTGSTYVFVSLLITEDPSNAMAIIGDSVSFSCTITSFPEPLYEWFKFGGNLPPGASGYNTSLLQVTTMPLDESEGYYYCRATSNDEFVDSEPAILYVSPYSVNIYSDYYPIDYIYYEGGYLYLYCDFYGGPDAVYQWLRFDEPLENENEYHFHRDILRADEDGGVYTCNVSNPAGSNSSSIMIYTEPVVEITPVDTSSSVGGTVNFGCRARGYPTPTYAWIYANGSLPENIDILTDENGTSIFSILSVDVGDQGEYHCNVTGSLSFLLSAFLTVLPPDTRVTILSFPNATVYSENDDIELTCILYGELENSFLWFRNGVLLTGLQQDEANSSSLFLYNIIALQDGGEYTCVVNNSVGFAIASWTLYIEPSLIRSPSDVHTSRGYNASMSCLATAYPDPVYQWIRIDGVLPASVLGSGNSSTLIFSRVQFQDEGSYYCTATSNGITLTSLAANLIVSPEGGVTILPDNAVLDVDIDMVILRCISEVRLDIVFQWSFNNEIIANETSENLTVDGISPSEDGGYFECLVSNPAGSGLYITALYFSPVITVHPVDVTTVNGSSNVMLNCTATAYPAPQYEWVKQRGPLPSSSSVTSNGDSSILTISTVVFGDEGYYSCIASSNNISTESYEATLHVSPEGSVRVSPSVITARFNTTITASCTAEGGPINQFTWSVVTVFGESSVVWYGPVLLITVRNLGNVIYACHVENAAGSELAQLTIYVLPPDIGVTILSFPNETVYSENDDIDLTCTSYGEQNSFLWYRNEVLLTGLQQDEANSSSLFLYNITALQDGGEYTCVVNNSVSFANASWTLYIEPSFILFPSDVHTSRGYNASMSCLATAYPEPVYQWIRIDGVLPASVLGSGNSSTLIFSRVQFQDEGSYYCTATSNGITLTSLAAYLIVSPKGGVTILPDNAVLNGNIDTVTLRCISEVRLDIVFQWSFNDEIIANETSENFTLNDITPSEDGGYYECLVSNSAGSGLYSTTLYFSPVITVHPVDTRTVNGSLNVMLNCTAAAYPTPQYEWIKEAGPLPSSSSVTSNGESSILTISTVVFGDEGCYSCLASSNNITTESYEATLYVSPLGSIEVLPGDAVYRVGDFVDLACTFEGGPRNSIQWFHNNEPIFNQRGPLLFIRDIDNRQAGEYTCNVFNSAGEDNVTTTVYIEPRIISSSTNRQRTVNDTVSFQCVAEGFPLPTILWEYVYYDDDIGELFDQLGSGILVNEEFGSTSNDLLGDYYGIHRFVDEGSGYVDSTLELFSVAYDDYGLYRCVVSSTINMQNFTVASNATLAVSPEGSVKVSPSVITAQFDTTITAGCTAEGGPDNQFTWSVVTGFGESSVVQYGPVLVINVTDIESGIYACHVENAAGYELAYLKIYVIPVVTEAPSDRNVTTTEDLRLVCCIRGSPTPLIDWYHNESLVTLNEQTTIEPHALFQEDMNFTVCSVITVANTGLPDSGQYTCTGVNAVGNVSSLPALVLIQDRPEKPIITGVMNVTSDSLILLWLEPHHNNAPLLGFHVLIMPNFITLTVENESLLVTGLEPGETYHFQVVAFNSIGDSLPSDPFSVTTLATVPEAPPENVTAVVLSSTGIMVQWSEVANRARNGEITHYEVQFFPLMEFDGGIYNGSVLTVDMSTVHILADLQEYVTYNISVRAYNGAGAGPYSDGTIVTTHQDVPSASPEDVEAVGISSRELFVTWSEVPDVDQNGIILRYEVEFKPTQSQSSRDISVLPTESRDITVSGLEIFTQYAIRVRAVTTIGSGPYSDEILAATLEDVPIAAPTNLSVIGVTSTVIELVWEELPVIYRNGIITAYEVEYRQLTFEQIVQNGTVNASNLTTRLTGLQEYVEYFIKIRAYTSIGPGPYSTLINTTTLQDFPSMSPANVTANVTSSTSMTVTWESVPDIHQNGIITQYEVQYSTESAFGGTATVITPASNMTINLAGLEEYTEYSIRVSAHTVVGAGSFSQPLIATTHEDVPAAPPARVGAFATSESSIQIAWDEVPAIHRNGIISLYEVLYWQSGDESDTTTVPVDPDEFVLDVDGLGDFLTYLIRVRASTAVGAGPYSSPAVEVAPEQDVPSAPPFNVSTQTISSSEILVTWNEVPAIERNGIITKYEVEYRQTTFSSDSVQNVEVTASTRQTTLDGLHKYTEYFIRVRAYTIIGDGPYSNNSVATTLQDTPDASPTNINVSPLSPTSLHVSWNLVPAVDRNGDITQYGIEYNQITFPQRPTSVTESLAAGNVSWTLSGLEEYVVYTVRVRAHTVIGAGPYSSPMTSRTLEDVPAGYPDSLSARPLSPTEVTLRWQSIPAIDHNGVLLYYEVLFYQSTFTSLPLTGVSVNNTQQSASVGRLQPFTPYSMTVRANTSAGYGPPNPDPVITMTDPTGLTLTIRNKDLVVKEGDDLNIVCEPSSETVGLEWVLPEAVSNNADTVVEYSEPLRHVLTIRNANIKHSGVYTCGVLGDMNGTISRDSATVRVREKCFEDFSGGLFWEIAFDEDTIAKPCQDIDNSFSMVVKVYRRCQSMRRWTPVDFSGCTLSSSEQQVLVIISLRVPTTSITNIDILDLEQQLIQGAHMDSGVEPRVLALEQLPQTLGEQSLLLLKVFYTTAEQAQTGSWDTVLCSEDDLTVGSTTVSIERREVAAVMRSDFCECRQVLQTPVGDGSGATDDGNTLLEPKLGCPVDNLYIQELCNGTLASPCDCTGSSLECECVSPYVGDGSLCVLDSDGDGYPNLALRTCSETDSFIYCSADTCPFARNPDQTDVSPCKGDETDCPEDIDSVWNILWPFTPPGVTVSVSCGVDFVGNATRRCRPDLNWEPPDVTNCQSRIFVDIMERVEEALVSEDTEVVLEVVEELVQATEAEDVPQLPQDLNTTNDIITNTLDLLFSDLEMNIQQNDTNATSVEATVVIFEALDNILSESNQASFDSLQEVGGAGSQAVLMNAESFSLYAAQVLALEQNMEPGQTANISVTGENLALRAQSIAVDEDTEYSFPSQQEIMQLTLPNSALADISLSSAILPESATGQDSNSVVVASILFTTLQSFLPPSATDTVAGEPVSLIISTQIAVGGQVMRTNLESPVTINFQFAAVPADDILEERVIQCAFWDFGNSTTDLSDSGWSADGVSTAMSTTVGNVSTVECASLHLTSFAVLVDVRGVEINTKALSIVSYIGLSFSSVCLIFTIIFFLSLRKELFTAVYNFVHLNLSIALLAGYIVFAVGVELAASNTIGCKAVTALVQYFFLAAFSWMLCEGVMLYLMLVVVFSTIKRKWWFFLLLGWGIPLPFIAIGLGAFNDDYGVKDITGKFKYCWLSSGEGKYAIWTFIAPMLAIILINVTFLVLVLRSIYKTKSNKQRKTSMKGEKADKNKKDIETAKSILKAAVILLPLLGMTWVFGLFAVNENTAVFAWLFTICNSLQGFFIFFFHVLRSKQVSGKLKKRYSLYSSTVSSKLGTLSSTLRRSTAKSSSTTSSRSLSSIRKFRTSSLSSSLTESESEWRSESIIIKNPKLPVIFEGKEVELKFLELNEESEYEESEFGPDDNDDDALESQTIVKVDLAAIEVK